MNTTVSRYRQPMRHRRTRARQEQVLRAHRRAVMPANDDRYLAALTIAPSR